MKRLSGILIIILLLQSCDVPYFAPGSVIKDTLPIGTNFKQITDSVLVSYDLEIDSRFQLNKGDQVAIAQFSDSTAHLDTVFVKIANTQEFQGWITSRELMRNYVPVDSISQIIYFLNEGDLLLYLGIIVSAFIVIFTMLGIKKRLPFILFNDIDNIYPLLLCLIVSGSAVLYQSVQIFTPQDWLHYYFVPSLSPFSQPLLIGGFLLSWWMILIAALAAVDVASKQLPTSGSTLAYVFGLLCFCIFCYIFFLITVPFRIGFVLYAAFVCYFLYRVIKEIIFRFRCGNCGQKMKKRGECPRCGVMNK